MSTGSMALDASTSFVKLWEGSYFLSVSLQVGLQYGQVASAVSGKYYRGFLKHHRLEDFSFCRNCQVSVQKC